jgi:iron complex outermembrane receptor protein
VAASFGNQNLEPEELTSFELGYRIEPNRRLSLDATLFYNEYRDLIRYDPGSPYFDPLPSPHVVVPVTARNSQSGETMGAELAARWQVTGTWRLEGSYTWLQMRVRPDSVLETESPQQQFQLRSSLDLPHHLEWNGVVYFVDQTTSTSGMVRQRVPAYVRLDVGVTWRPIPSLEIGLWAQNLLDNHHPEFNTFRTSLQTEIPRGVLGKITWHF